MLDDLDDAIDQLDTSPISLVLPDRIRHIALDALEHQCQSERCMLCRMLAQQIGEWVIAELRRR